MLDFPVVNGSSLYKVWDSHSIPGQGRRKNSGSLCTARAIHAVGGFFPKIPGEITIDTAGSSLGPFDTSRPYHGYVSTVPGGRLHLS